MSDAEVSNDKKIVGALAALALAIALVWGGVSLSKERTAKAGCAVGASAIAALAVGMSKGRATDDVVKIAGPGLAGAGCVAAVDDLLKHDKTVLSIKTNNGTFARTVTRGQLIGSPRHATTSRMIACRGWTAPVLFDMCVEGDLAPR